MINLLQSLYPSTYRDLCQKESIINLENDGIGIQYVILNN